MPDYEVSAALIQAWSGVKNGKLPALAGHAFDVFIAVDKHLLQQQNQADPQGAVILAGVLSNQQGRRDACVDIGITQAQRARCDGPGCPDAALCKPVSPTPRDQATCKLVLGLASRRSTPAHSITSLTEARKVLGTARPRRFAVLRLSTSSKCVDCMTGISAGFAPLRICPT